jgi:hypothetical protein
LPLPTPLAVSGLEDARLAAILLCKGIGAKAESIGVELLRDIQTVFMQVCGELPEDDRAVTTESLLLFLNKMEDRPWATFCNHKPLHAWRLSKLLSPYGVAPTRYKQGGMAQQGYRFCDFADVFNHYLSPVQGEKIS